MKKTHKREPLVLLFGTAGGRRIAEVVRSAPPGSDILFVATKHLSGVVRESGLELQTIEVDENHIDYREISSKGFLRGEYFDEVWVPSSFPDNYGNFGQVYALLTEIRYGEMYWFGSGGLVIHKKNTAGFRMRERAYYALANAVYSASWMLERCGSKLRGFRW